VMEQMASGRASLAALAERLPHYVMRKRQIACPPNLVYKVLDRFRARHADHSPDCTDGVRIAWPDAWLHVRASNTEPLLRIIAEGESADRADALIEEALTFARRITYGHGG
jgi:phosphomannomutase